MNKIIIEVYLTDLCLDVKINRISVLLRSFLCVCFQIHGCLSSPETLTTLDLETEGGLMSGSTQISSCCPDTDAQLASGFLLEMIPLAQPYPPKLSVSRVSPTKLMIFRYVLSSQEQESGKLLTVQRVWRRWVASCSLKQGLTKPPNFKLDQ